MDSLQNARSHGERVPRVHDGVLGQADAAVSDATAAYTEHKELLFAVVYNMLGTVADTEDALQDTWLSWVAAQRQDVGNARGYLLRIAVNQALARLRRLRRSRETYVGPWLPEPLVVDHDAAEGVMRMESISLALLVVLETLTPLERAVFVLREAFGYENAEIAALLGRSAEAVRQVAHRARKHVSARHSRYKPDPDLQRIATQRFLAAALGGDIATLLEVLAPDVTLWTDGGGKLRAALRVITGRDKVLRLLAARDAYLPTGLNVRYLTVNGEPGALVLAGDLVYGVMVADLEPEGGRISSIYAVLNPDKLKRIHPSASDDTLTSASDDMLTRG
jgi:RNA polymerase sigma factor (sigma-70 family)